MEIYHILGICNLEIALHGLSKNFVKEPVPVVIFRQETPKQKGGVGWITGSRKVLEERRSCLCHMEINQTGKDSWVQETEKGAT